jgi:intergrase/recombinase
MSMDIFKWAEDMEKIYEELIEKGKQENLDEITKVRTEQENLLETKIAHYRDTVDFALKSLIKSLESEDQIIKVEIDNLKKKMEKKYRENKDDLITLLIKNLRLDF